MNNEWLNLSSGCQRPARRDYFLGTAVTFIGLDSGRIGERPLLGCIGWVTDRDGRRQKERDREKERKGATARPALHTSLNSSTSILDRMRNTVSWPWPIKQGKKQRGYNPPTHSHKKVTKTRTIVEEEQENVCFLTFHFVTFVNVIIKKTKHLAHRLGLCSTQLGKRASIFPSRKNAIECHTTLHSEW